MKILHTVEFYNPSVGGAQEVVRQVSEGLVKCGHQVTVATTKSNLRKSLEINGVQIEEFDIRGNAVSGMKGEVQRYQDFLLHGNFDVMMNYAAQQWTMDAVFPFLKQIPYRKIMIPCGFSNLYNVKYSNYFQTMPEVMKQYDHVIFHASQYRDIEFARQHGIDHYSVIPNGASFFEFSTSEINFRQKYNISEAVPLLITIGSHTGQKGHHLILEAFRRLQTKNAVLIIIGNLLQPVTLWSSLIRPFFGAISRGNIKRLGDFVKQTIFGGIGSGCLPDCRMLSRRINQTSSDQKRVIMLDPSRKEVVAALQSADLFVFGSNIEYSPLVLFEAMAAGTPFLSLACGNAAEIVTWTGGGLIAPTILTKNGLVYGSPVEFAQMIDNLLKNTPARERLAESGHSVWLKQFTWEKIALQYETLYQEILK